MIKIESLSEVVHKLGGKPDYFGFMTIESLPTPYKVLNGKIYFITKSFASREDFYYPNRVYPAYTQVICTSDRDGKYYWNFWA